ncbi:MAG TPA: putative peptidoglycan glycosyltransferase FtsW [Streptosporangiaceae bacterium]|nr:putative peptidoglycan glycosyltransferase FtsW [Streptosporangiaceae bacterium]
MSTAPSIGTTDDDPAHPAHPARRASLRLPVRGEARTVALAGTRRVRDAATRLVALLDKPLASYYLVLGCTLLLLAVGLMMVLSAGTAYDLDNGLPPYSMFIKQLAGAVVGLVLMWVAAKSPPRLFRACAYPLLLAALAGVALVLLFGVEVDGAKRWLIVAGTQVQPSELAKLALVVWGADLLARKERLGQLTDWRHLLIPLLPGAALLSLLVLLGRDMGTTFLLIVIFLALLWIIGTPRRLLAGLAGLMAFVLLVVVAVHPYELARITAFFAAHSPSCQSLSCYQLIQGKDALGSGGLFGVGTGASRAKWGWVPNSPTDFIFAILGEELGLVGTLCVVALYGGIAFAGLRIARRAPDTFSRLAAGAITVWLVVQAMVNMGAVLGLLPISGVPLPLISAGVSSLLASLVALGMLMAFARTEPGAARALAAAGPATPLRLLRRLGLGRGGAAIRAAADHPSSGSRRRRVAPPR